MGATGVGIGDWFIGFTWKKWGMVVTLVFGQING
jgi:hypothetical protein